MATKKKPFTMRMQPENFDKIRVIAALNKRSIAMQIEYLLEQCISEYESAHGKISLFGNEKRPRATHKSENGSNYGLVGGNFSPKVTIN